MSLNFLLKCCNIISQTDFILLVKGKNSNWLSLFILTETYPLISKWSSVKVPVLSNIKILTFPALLTLSLWIQNIPFFFSLLKL